MPVRPSLAHWLRPALAAAIAVAAVLSAPPSVKSACAAGPDTAKDGPAWASQSGATCPARSADTRRTAARLDQLRAQIAASAAKDGPAPVALDGSGYHYGNGQQPAGDTALIEYEAKGK